MFPQYIIGQNAAKRAVAIALRNRWRRQNVPEDLRDEIAPKNIIMVDSKGILGLHRNDLEMRRHEYVDKWKFKEEWPLIIILKLHL